MTRRGRAPRSATRFRFTCNAGFFTRSAGSASTGLGRIRVRGRRRAARHEAGLERGQARAVDGAEALDPHRGEEVLPLRAVLEAGQGLRGGLRRPRAVLERDDDRDRERVALPEDLELLPRGELLHVRPLALREEDRLRLPARDVPHRLREALGGLCLPLAHVRRRLAGGGLAGPLAPRRGAGRSLLLAVLLRPVLLPGARRGRRRPPAGPGAEDHARDE